MKEPAHDDAEMLSALRQEYERLSDLIELPGLQVIQRRAARMQRLTNTAIAAAALLLVAVPTALQTSDYWDRSQEASVPLPTRVLDSKGVETSSPSLPSSSHLSGDRSVDKPSESTSKGVKPSVSSAPDRLTPDTSPPSPSPSPRHSPAGPARGPVVQILFRLNKYTDGGCRKVAVTRRALPSGVGPAAYIQAVLAGPTAAERALGVRSVFGKGGRPTQAAVSTDQDQRIVIVDFASINSLARPPTGCGGREIVWPLRYAISQWNSKWNSKWRVGFSINGDKAAFNTYFQSTRSKS